MNPDSLRHPKFSTAKLIVQKFGGSSLSTPAHVRRAATRIRDVKELGVDLVIVVSAMGRMTDHLIQLAGKTVANPPRREMDMLLSVGERVSMSLLAMALEDLGVPAISFTGSQSGIVTTSEHLEAKILQIRPARILAELAVGRVVIIAGFQGVSEAREITTLGRGGSDTTAVALAAALKADRCEIFTDVDGIYTADPRLVPNARLIDQMEFSQALEFASLGAKMHARSIELARRFDVPLRIAANWARGMEGTWVTGPEWCQESPKKRTEKKELRVEGLRVLGIGSKSGFSLYRVVGSLLQVQEIFRNAQVPVRCFSSSVAGGRSESLFLVEDSKEAHIRTTILASGLSCESEKGYSLISLVGEGLCASSALVPDFLEALAKVQAEPVIVNLTSISISAAVETSKTATAVRELHERFLEELTRSENEGVGEALPPRASDYASGVSSPPSYIG